MSGRRLRTRHQSRALLLRAVPYGESDTIFTFFFETLGKQGVLARRIRRPSPRQPMHVDTMHTLLVTVDERAGADSLLTLQNAKLDTVRPRLVADLDRLLSAGRVLRWVRDALPTQVPEPTVWAAVTQLLDQLNTVSDPVPLACRLASVGLQLLQATGYGFDFVACARCGRSCSADQSGYFDPRRGGLLCRSCGGTSGLLDGETRARLAACQRGEQSSLNQAEGEQATRWVEQALAAHVHAAVLR